jgi:hypothetical protein
MRQQKKSLKQKKTEQRLGEKKIECDGIIQISV